MVHAQSGCIDTQARRDGIVKQVHRVFVKVAMMIVDMNKGHIGGNSLLGHGERRRAKEGSCKQQGKAEGSRRIKLHHLRSLYLSSVDFTRSLQSSKCQLGKSEVSCKKTNESKIA